MFQNTKKIHFIALRLFILSCCLLVSLGFSASIFAQQSARRLSVEQYQSRISAVHNKTEVIKKKNKLAKQQLEQIRKTKNPETAKVKPEDVTNDVREQAILDLALARANLDSARISLAEIVQMQDATNSKIAHIQDELRTVTLAAGKTTALRERLKFLQTQLNFQKALLEAQDTQAKEIRRANDYTKQIYQLQLVWKDHIFSLYQLRQQQLRQVELQKQETELEQKQKYWLEKLADLNQQVQAFEKDQPITDKERERIQLQIFEAQEKSNLLHLEIVLARLSNQLEELVEAPETEYNVNSLNIAISQTETLLSEVKDLRDLVGRKLELIELRRKVDIQSLESSVISPEELKSGKLLLDELLQSYNHEMAKINDLEVLVKDQQSQLQKELNRALARRQGLPGLSLEAWTNLGEKLILMPSLAVQAGKALLSQVHRAIHAMTKWQIVGIVLIELILAWGWLIIRHFLSLTLQKIEENKQKLADNFVFALLKLIQRNLTGLFIFAGFLLFIYLAGLSFKSFSLVVYLAVVWFTFKSAIILSRLTLLETAADVSGKDVRMYKHLKLALIAGGLLTTLTVLSHGLPVGYEVRDFFNRLFMLFLLITSIVLLKGWMVVPIIVAPYVDGARPYIMRVIKLFSFILPLIILSTAVIGILGYVDLAWTISKYEGVFLIILLGYVLARGLLVDLLEWVSELFIRRLRNGWLWTQAILRPLDRVLRLGLIFLAIFTLFMAYGWDQDSYVVQALRSILNTNLVKREGVSITPYSIIMFMVSVAVLYWVAKWTREFAYRWLFARTRDLGLRNSLAAFTQYTMVIIGLYIALTIIDIDVTVISYILTALAFGIGFGLRDLAKNYVSGFLLLIERPVRAGDLVTVGNFEGEVTHIGMRSMTVKTWDHMEVLVPNSETFEKPFTNWTHQDSIVRTVITIKINRQDDPHFVQQLILETIENINEVVFDPAPQVFLKDIQEALIEFQVRYFINVGAGISRARTRSMVLFAIADVFKANGIKPPHPQHDIHITENTTKVSQ